MFEVDHSSHIGTHKLRGTFLTEASLEALEPDKKVYGIYGFLRDGDDDRCEFLQLLLVLDPFSSAVKFDDGPEEFSPATEQS